ncbi:hypothetical protein NKR23_g8452 [Pleurostoma richardsiae]|uniref:Uncharacterized protein n=1 Tax=Pleurostoma richardsiae TaxID=41990 RepID=A0AA38REW8_9PEZI|nr:hypothetical protein NKR23_g8452 [Pleurostoma richardsiae]
MILKESNPQSGQWDARLVLDILNPGTQGWTCVGTAVSTGRRCRGAIGEVRRSSASTSLQYLSRGQPSALLDDPDPLKPLAASLLCHRHGNQVAKTVAAWQEGIKKWTASQEDTKPGRAMLDRQSSRIRSSSAHLAHVDLYTPRLPRTRTNLVSAPRSSVETRACVSSLTMDELIAEVQRLKIANAKLEEDLLAERKEKEQREAKLAKVQAKAEHLVKDLEFAEEDYDKAQDSFEAEMGDRNQQIEELASDNERLDRLNKKLERDNDLLRMRLSQSGH